MSSFFFNQAWSILLPCATLIIAGGEEILPLRLFNAFKVNLACCLFVLLDWKTSISLLFYFLESSSQKIFSRVPEVFVFLFSKYFTSELVAVVKFCFLLVRLPTPIIVSLVSWFVPYGFNNQNSCNYHCML